MLDRFAFEHQASIAEHRNDLCCAIRKVAEVLAGQVEHLFVDFVDTHFVARPAVAGEGSGA
ncbi:MAG: hypothetical protein AW09_001952 [Candidatus Accumulibacter phosphatis]|uniref:Uncharacterized protein n=1 Tax=Candidatus Accumulibacter phosphatis TaxID=327160 RepID=A0A080LVU4_9PROT|nr:MAG: hypothetical protein AW09_001952 [Candidatus Accumulibacter phosphatis]